MKKHLSRFIGTKEFYAMTLMVVVPIIVQNGITNFVSLLDNLMVGRVGTDPMSGVAIINQLMFVFNLCVFGGVAGPGIFTAQFYGSDNQKGIRYTIRLKFMVVAFLTLVSILLFVFCGEPLIGLYLHDGGSSGSVEETLRYGKDYLAVMVWGLVPFAISQVYAGTLRETGETVLPMKAGILAVFVNLVLNYILIFGNFGAPKLGVVGAAIATVVSRYVEAIVIVAWTHTHPARNPFIIGLYKGFSVPLPLARKILLRGFPLMLNEALWSTGMALLMQCYSIRGLVVVAGMNISSTVTNLFNVLVISFGSAVSIIIGKLLGAGEMEEARRTNTWLMAFAMTISVGVGLLMASMSHVFPMLYNTSDEIRSYASQFILVSACCMPIMCFLNCAYFALRSGGRTVITFFFDCGFMFVFSAPVAFVLSRFTTLPILPLYALVQSLDLIKCVIGFVLLKKGTWLNNMVEEKTTLPIEIEEEPA